MLKPGTALILAQTGLDISTMGLASCHRNNLGGIPLRGSQFTPEKNHHKERSKGGKGDTGGETGEAWCDHE